MYQKLHKRLKRKNLLRKTEKLEPWTKGVEKLSRESTEGVNSQSKVDRENSEKELVPRKESNELDAVEVSFNNNEDDRIQ